jgi:TctA family transporter
VWSRTAGTVFYDSVLFGVLLFTYPIYLVTLSALFHGLFGISMVVTMLALPVGFRLTSMRVVKK